MARFPATSVRMGVFVPGSRPPECSALTSNEDCAVLDHPEQVGETRLEPFELDRREVTNGELAAWLNAHADLWRPPDEKGVVTTRREPVVSLIRTKQCGDGLTISSEGRAQVTSESEQWPVVCVSWHGAKLYCNEQRVEEQRKRLPLEAEWEFAAKGAGARPFPWGSKLPRQDGVAFDLGYGAQVHPRAVGSSRQDVTPDGVFDLGGNVAEWVDNGRGDNEWKTVRGGSFHSSTCHLLSSGCQRAGPSENNHRDLGFRCARSVID